MSTKNMRKNINAQSGKQQDILPLPHISAKTLFEDKREAEKWYTLLYQRRIAITNLIKNTTASMYTKDCKRDAEEFIIVSPCTDGIYRYQLTKFDKLGPVYDVRRDDAAEIAKEIPNSYGLIEAVE